VIVQYMPASDLRGAPVMSSGLTGAQTYARVYAIEPATPAARGESIAKAAHGAARVIVATYVRRIEGEGRFAMANPVAQWLDTLATHEHVVVVSFGNPYLLRQFPSVGSYLVTYGVADVLEQAAADALLGRAAITAHVPVSLPGFFALGDGIQRDAVAATR
ncbi:MAG: hypothetical protein ACHQRK_06400, partial [Gemmatimonadales bacterium]